MLSVSGYVHVSLSLITALKEAGPLGVTGGGRECVLALNTLFGPWPYASKHEGCRRQASNKRNAV